MFIIHSRYQKPLSEVERFLDAHIAFLDKFYQSGALLCSGRKMPRTGGVILCRTSSADEVLRMLEEDPFQQQGIAQYELIEFTPSKYADGLELLR